MGKQKLCVDTSKILDETKEVSTNGRRLGGAVSSFVPCNCVGEWRGMHEKLKKVSKNIGGEKVWQKVAGLLALACRREDGEVFFSAREEQIRALERSSAMRESLLEVLSADIAQSLRTCEERPVGVKASEVSYVASGRG